MWGAWWAIQVAGADPIRVAVQAPPDDPLSALVNPDVDGLVQQLDDDTWFDFEAERVGIAQVDSLEELAQYDVLVIGNSGYASHQDFDATSASVWIEWVDSGHGAVVSTAWLAYVVDTLALTWLDDLLPFDATDAYDSCDGTELALSDPAHPVTLDVVPFQSDYVESPSSALDGANALALVTCETATGLVSPIVAVSYTSLGKTVYLGPPYMGAPYNNPEILRSGDADRLLEQAVAWASDNDDDGVVNSLDCVFYTDSDADGYGDPRSPVVACEQPQGTADNALDCDDERADISPGEPERCDDEDLDEDCDLLSDDEDDSVREGSQISWWPDADEDGYGSELDPGVLACDLPQPGWSPLGGDCDDATPAVNPGAVEVVNGLDDDCDDLLDDSTEVYDDDGDGATEDQGDCDDSDDTAFPGGVESCDGVDNDCDNQIDEQTPCYDDDGDGFSEDQDDCDDTNPEVSPAAVEVDNNGLDDDCDGATDLPDLDGDGHSGEDDCDDSDETVYVGAPELEDGLDNDCDGTVDEETPGYDDDGDGFSEDDCDDSEPSVNPGADELPNGLDDDCDGSFDEGTEPPKDDTRAPEGCCDSSGSGWPDAWPLLLVVIVSRFRRELGKGVYPAL